MDPITGIVGLAGVSIAALGGLLLKPKDEGFETLNSGEFNEYANTGGYRYNNLSQVLNPMQNALIPLNATKAQADEARAKMNAALQAPLAQTTGNQQTLSLAPPKTDLLPRKDADKDLLATIDFCNNRLKTTDRPFKDPRFKKNCGICVRSGIDEKGNRFNGKMGMYINPIARKAALDRQERENLFFTPAAPSLGTCDGAPADATFALSTEDLEKYLKREECKASRSLDGDCGKCFEEENYTFVGKKPDRIGIKIVVQGQGTYYLTVGSKWFKGELTSSAKSLIVNSITEGVNMSLLVETIKEGGKTITPKVAGYLVASLPNGSPFIMPLNRIFTTDTESGGKPRFSGEMYEMNAEVEPAAFLQPGRGKTKMNLVGQIPFTFLAASEFATLDCNDNPLQTKVESLSKPITNPCYKKGQTPGNYSEACLRQIILDSGCTNAGTLFKDPKQLNQPGSGILPRFMDIFKKVQGIASRDGYYKEETMLCSGRKIDLVCQPFQNDPGFPISPDCLASLYKNTGARQPPLAATYLAPSQFQNETKSEPNLFCSPDGVLNPILPNGQMNWSAITELQQIGMNGFQGLRGVEAVKAYLDTQLKIAISPNQNAYTNDERDKAVKNCFGKLANPRTSSSGTPEVFAVGPGYDYTQMDARLVCSRFGAQLATDAQLQTAFKNGANWCFTAWLADSPSPKFPTNTNTHPGCGGSVKVHEHMPATKKAGATCFGVKPSKESGAPAGVLPFNEKFWSQPPKNPEVFVAGTSYDFTPQQAPEVCAKYGARVATEKELSDAQKAGAQWCTAAWVSDSKNAMYPMNKAISGCGNSVGVMNFGAVARANVNCFGYKPAQGRPPPPGLVQSVQAFAPGKWSQHS